MLRHLDGRCRVREILSSRTRHRLGGLLLKALAGQGFAEELVELEPRFKSAARSLVRQWEGFVPCGFEGGGRPSQRPHRLPVGRLSAERITRIESDLRNRKKRTDAVFHAGTLAYLRHDFDGGIDAMSAGHAFTDLYGNDVKWSAAFAKQAIGRGHTYRGCRCLKRAPGAFHSSSRFRQPHSTLGMASHHRLRHNRFPLLHSLMTLRLTVPTRLLIEFGALTVAGFESGQSVLSTGASTSNA